ncbi:hypothetical protein JRC42_24100 (plasmid) [Escherichia albertii]|uniref:hypothetical protein n=1 Tax=Escherichia albertii TaxID=208962 RepID=UPI00195C0B41|nr:hypothetical protein [Escherichia albertii]QST30933.1 hypothetical protein JRC42_24100 [Escherichia albertii]QST40246.1 hypothetical protein JRC46_24895 [Escherichia albertii]
MKYHFISDDSFFLQGVSAITLPRRKQPVIHFAGVMPESGHFSDGDIVVINIADIARRQEILQLRRVAHCRVIILLRTRNDSGCQTRGHFPWIIPAGTRLSTLEHVLSCATVCEPVQRSVTKAQQRLFHYLCRGYSLSFMEKRMKVTTKYLYVLKLRTIKKYGLHNSHAVSVLLCRDMTGIIRR